MSRFFECDTCSQQQECTDGEHFPRFWFCVTTQGRQFHLCSSKCLAKLEVPDSRLNVKSDSAYLDYWATIKKYADGAK